MRSRPAPPALLVLALALLAVLLPGAAASAAVAPAITLSPASGPVGTSTTVVATGLPARARATLTVGTTAYALRTDLRGALTRTVTVPPPAAGATTVPVRVQAGAVGVAAAFAVRAPAAPRLRFGVATPGGLWGGAELDRVAAVAGEAPTIVLSYADFTRELDVAGLEQVAARGAVPMLTWEPWQAGAGLEQPAYALRRIAGGEHDAYLRRWADGLRAHGRPVLLRFAHEMNGDWYPWSERVGGAAPGDYVAAWRHVHDVFRAAGATNVSWVWSPNAPYPGSLALDGLYPGPAYVDVVALDAYNFGASQPWTSWVEPAQLYGPGLAELRRLAPGTPVLVAETASTELGGSKPAWVRDAVAFLAAQPDVTGFVWFDLAKETDWRIASSAESATAFAEALRARRG